jgi:hypothetical protein
MSAAKSKVSRVRSSMRCFSTPDLKRESYAVGPIFDKSFSS